MRKLIVTLFLVLSISSGNASSNNDRAQTSDSAHDEHVNLIRLAHKEAAGSKERKPLAQSLSSDVDSLSSLEPGEYQEESKDSPIESGISELSELRTAEYVDSTEEEKKRNSKRKKQLGVDYFRVDSEESKEKWNNKAKLIKAGLDDDTKQFIKEIEAGDMTVLLGTNQHLLQPDLYPDFARRFVLQYPYKEIVNKVEEDEEPHLKPKMAPPELVLQVAKESAILDAASPKNPTEDLIHKDILRTGNYWNSYWKEDVDPKILRTKPKKLQSLKAKVLPGTDIYELVAKLKQFSPKLLYIVNTRSK